MMYFSDSEIEARICGCSSMEKLEMMRSMAFGALVAGNRELRDRLRAPILIVTPQIDAHIRRLFPFQFTADQDRAIANFSESRNDSRVKPGLFSSDSRRPSLVASLTHSF